MEFWAVTKGCMCDFVWHTRQGFLAIAPWMVRNPPEEADRHAAAPGFLLQYHPSPGFGLTRRPVAHRCSLLAHPCDPHPFRHSACKSSLFLRGAHECWGIG